MIPIKGYATFDPLKHCWIGSGFKIEWFSDLPIYKENKIMDPLKRIADETEEDFQSLEKILKDAGVQTYRSFLDFDKAKSLRDIYKPPIAPRDHFAVIGEKIYACSKGLPGYAGVLKQIDRSDIVFTNQEGYISTALICRIGKDLWVNQIPERNSIKNELFEKYKQNWTKEGFRVHISHHDYHTDGAFCVVKPGCIVSLYDVKNYSEEFPGWDVLYLPDQSWNDPYVKSFVRMKNKVGGKWWIKGEEHNAELISFVNKWLNEWVGYVEETVFDVNMLSIDQNTIVCNNYNKEVFEHFKKHKVEPIVFNFRHRYFWDSGIHCITQDLYREGKQEDYFG